MILIIATVIRCPAFISSGSGNYSGGGGKDDDDDESGPVRTNCIFFSCFRIARFASDDLLPSLFAFTLRQLN